MPEVIIIGAGPAGLTAAFKLKQKKIDVLVLEAQDLPGGNIKTISERGFLMETGPHTFMGTNEFIFKLVDELGLANSLEPASPAANNRYIFRDGKLMPLPTGLVPFLKTPLLSAKAKMRLTLEPFIPNGAQPMETAWEFFCRRFGEEAATYIMSPFISGIYAGNAKILGARASFPKFWNFERESGSMILGAAKFMWRKNRRLAEEGVKPKKGLFSFKQGLGTLTSKLAQELKGSVITGASAEKIYRQNGKFLVKTQSSEFSAPVIIVATPPNKTADILGDFLPEVSANLKSIPMAPVALLHWSLAGNGFPAGFGFLMPRLYDLRVLGTLFPSQLFSNRAPQGINLFASFYSGMLDPAAVNLSDEKLEKILIKEHKIIFGKDINAHEILKILRYQAAIPQLLPDHPEKISAVLGELKKTPGLFLAGNYLTGVGLEHAVQNGYAAAAEVEKFLSVREEIK